jgi:toxin ParE1/3/4
MQIVWTSRAVADLTEIRQLIADDSPSAANRVAQKILASAERLSRHPHLGHPGREPGMRELGVPGLPDILCYTVHRRRLAILAVLHTSRERLD